MKERASRNRTLTLDKEEEVFYKNELKKMKDLSGNIPDNTIINGDIFKYVELLQDDSVDLLFLDPPYNLTKKFNSNSFNQTNRENYNNWFDSWFKLLVPKLKKSASVFVCGDWKTSLSIYDVIGKYLIVHNRITWEREKGRGAKTNFKNSHEDIWFASKSKTYTFNVEDVKLKRKVIAPYRSNGKPKDWQKEETGNYRLTYPSNLWTDISIPFWSMPENTDHPTQKPEKLLAKLILACSNENDLVLDPFLGSGTTAVVAKKLNRKYIGIELDPTFACLALKRLEQAESNKSIQGYYDGVFWERNSLNEQKKS